MTIVRTRTPSGEAIAVLPEAEFDRLRELADDTLDARARELSQQCLTSGTEELLSDADLDALRAAPSALTFWRMRRGTTIGRLAEVCAVPEAVIASMERGEPIADHLCRKRAPVLDVAVLDLRPEPA